MILTVNNELFLIDYKNIAQVSAIFMSAYFYFGLLSVHRRVTRGMRWRRVDDGGGGVKLLIFSFNRILREKQGVKNCTEIMHSGLQLFIQFLSREIKMDRRTKLSDEQSSVQKKTA